jgi:hypothetical protein
VVFVPISFGPSGSQPVDGIVMKKLLFTTLACGLCATAALAQQEADTAEFDGKWNVSLQAGGGRPFAATLTLENFGGTWYDAASGGLVKGKHCKGRKFPITVQNSVHAELAFTVWGSAVSAACPDIGVTLKPLGEKALEGTTASGATIRLTRR